MDVRATFRRAGLVADELGGVYRMAGGLAAARYAAAIARSLPEVLRAKNLRAADARMGERDWSVRANGRVLRIPGRYWSGAREMYGRAVYFPTKDFAIAPGDLVVDLGANAGLFTLLAAASGARVLAVEAQSGFRQEIVDNLVVNGLAPDRVDVVTALVGSGTGVFATPDAVRSGSHGHETPPVVELGALLDAHGFTRVDFLKMDIEGSEFSLFAGEPAWLERVRRIAMEVHPAHGAVAPLVAMLRRRGFRAWSVDDRGHPTETPSVRGGYVFGLREDARASR